jgi:Cu-Zn family superoxide dismutase
MKTRKQRVSKQVHLAVAVFETASVRGTFVARPTARGVSIAVTFSALPKGPHGFHIHTAGDLRGEGCKGACAHYQKGPSTTHGGPPTETDRPRHTGDLGNIEMPPKGDFHHTYHLRGVHIHDLWGRSVIVHADSDDLGLGGHDDSKTTGHSGARIACAIIGRGSEMC